MYRRDCGGACLVILNRATFSAVTKGVYYINSFRASEGMLKCQSKSRYVSEEAHVCLKTSSPELASIERSYLRISFIY